MSKFQERGNCWSVTINNPIDSDEENIAMARQKGWKVEGQKEKGENGTLHYQLILKTEQVRFSAVKKAFPRAHIEKARNAAALQQYVHKDETKVEEMQQQNELYPSLQKLWDMFADWLYTCDKGVTMTKWYNTSDGDRRAAIFDDFINAAILKGYVVETMGVNPQIRGCIMRYGRNIVQRSLDRQTDRQTVEKNVEVDSITDAEESDEETSCRQASSETSSTSEE